MTPEKHTANKCAPFSQLIKYEVTIGFPPTGKNNLMVGSNSSD